VKYTAGGSITVAGRTLGPGQTIEFPRSLGIVRVRFPYEIEYYRGNTIPTFPSPPTGTLAQNYVLMKPFAGITSGDGNGGVSVPSGGAGLNWNADGVIWQGANPPSGNFPLFTVSGGVLTTINTLAPFGSPWLVPGNRFEYVGMEGAFMRYNAVAGGTLEDPPGDPIVNCFSWAVALGSGPGIPFTPYASIPVVASPGTATFPWMAGNAVVDIIKCTRLPTVSLDFNASLTLRSACEVPAP
jgi:hypothetical protein